MNPDNPNFRTPEEEARAAELVRLKAELADLKWHWQEATKFVMPGEFDTAESIKHYIDTLESENERLKRVVEKLREQRDTLIVHAHDDSATKIQIQTYRANLDAELDAIGKGEGLG